MNTSQLINQNGLVNSEYLSELSKQGGNDFQSQPVATAYFWLLEATRSALETIDVLSRTMERETEDMLSILVIPSSSGIGCDSIYIDRNDITDELDTSMLDIDLLMEIIGNKLEEIGYLQIILYMKPSYWHSCERMLLINTEIGIRMINDRTEWIGDLGAAFDLNKLRELLSAALVDDPTIDRINDELITDKKNRRDPYDGISTFAVGFYVDSDTFASSPDLLQDLAMSNKRFTKTKPSAHD